MEADASTEEPKAHNQFRCGHTPRSGFGRAFNTGAIIFRNTPTTLEFLLDWRKWMTSPEHEFATVGAYMIGARE